MSHQLTDTFGRKFYYLRLSITDVCNFRCTYCLPHGYQPACPPAHDFLTLDEIKRVTAAFAALGTEKVRLTGGEPTLRRDFCDIVAAIRANPAIHTLAVTTNGYRLGRDAARWREAGLTALNVSVDSLDPRQFLAITGENKLSQILLGIDKALEAGFATVKVNTVLLRGLNDHSLAAFLHWIKTRPIQIRFIELMETGDGSELFRQRHVSGDTIRQRLLQQGWQCRPRGRSDGPAQVFSHPDYQGEVGLIMPYERHFCDSCNRLRVSSQGQLHLCLFGEQGVPLRDLLGESTPLEQLKARITEAVQQKRPTHFLHQGQTGMTRNLSYIGG